MIDIFFWSPLDKVKLPRFIIIGYVRQILGRGAFLPHPHPGAAPRRPILNRVKNRPYLLLIIRRIPLIVRRWWYCGKLRKLLTFFILQTFLFSFLLQFLLSTELIITSKSVYDNKLSWLALHTKCEILKKAVSNSSRQGFLRPVYCGVFAYNWLCIPKSCQFFGGVLGERD